MPTVCLLCSIFTLESADPSKNKYISMFNFWLSSLITSKSLNKNDKLVIILDQRTMDFLIGCTVFNSLLKLLPCSSGLTIIPSPKTFEAGCMYRYYVNFDYEQDILLYTDIDIQFIQSLKIIVAKMKPNFIYLHAEGLLKDSNYGTYLSEIERNLLFSKIENLPGYNSGKFAFWGKDYHKIIFSLLWQQHEEIVKEMLPKAYCYDQCLFNRAIYTSCLLHGLKIDSSVFAQHCTNFSGFQNSTDLSDIVIIDCCGEPGKEDLHFTKIQYVHLQFLHFRLN
jgi:hypothetical protein